MLYLGLFPPYIALHRISRIEPVKLPNYLNGEWSQPSGEREPLLDPVRGVELAHVSSAAVFINTFNFPSWGIWEKAAHEHPVHGNS
jgi:hypothetical protein